MEKSQTIDGTTLLAHSIYNNPGVYALLIGSGLSSAAGIPTGWGITTDLIRRVAILEGEEDIHDPEAWYRGRFDQPPDYSALLNRLGPTRSERQAIIRRYIEPTPDELTQGLKAPTVAHDSIAQLAAKGYIRVILTTNFDRLIEQALAKEAVDFDIISTVDNLAGTRPLGQAPCVVIKLHGDYRDSRILNTSNELETYPVEFDSLLDRVLDECGVIVCGWSAKWDPALRKAILRQPNRRYTMWWSSRGITSESASEIVQSRKGQIIEGLDGDHFFETLLLKTKALEEYSSRHPADIASAIAELKIYLPEPTKHLKLRDLVLNEAKQVHQTIINIPAANTDTVEFDLLRKLVERLHAESKVLTTQFSIGCAWSTSTQPFKDALELVADVGNPPRHITLVTLLQNFPALLCLYAGGIAATHTENWAILRGLTTDAVFQDVAGQFPMVVGLNQWRIFRGGKEAQWLPGQERKFTPVSNHLFNSLRETLNEVIPVESRFEMAFDRFEYLIGLLIQDQWNQEVILDLKAPIGRFGWKFMHKPIVSERNPETFFQRMVNDNNASCPILDAGLFDGSLERFQNAIKDFREHTKGVTQLWN